jgi:hypothetical protein
MADFRYEVGGATVYPQKSGGGLDPTTRRAMRVRLAKIFDKPMLPIYQCGGDPLRM